MQCTQTGELGQGFHTSTASLSLSVQYLRVPPGATVDPSVPQTEPWRQKEKIWGGMRGGKKSSMY